MVDMGEALGILSPQVPADRKGVGVGDVLGSFGEWVSRYESPVALVGERVVSVQTLLEGPNARSCDSRG